MPVLLLDGTGVRAGDPQTHKNGVELHLAVGLVARRREGGRTVVEARLLGATLAEPWSAMATLLEGLQPRLVIVDGEEAITDRDEHRARDCRQSARDHELSTPRVTLGFPPRGGALGSVTAGPSFGLVATELFGRTMHNLCLRPIPKRRKPCAA